MKLPRSLWAMLSLAIFVVSLVLAWRLFTQPAPPEEAEHEPPDEPIRVVAATAVNRPVEDSVLLTGTIQPLPAGLSRVAAQVAGRVAAVRVTPGQVVAQGDVIAILSRGDLSAQQRQTEAALRESQAELSALQSERAARAATLPLDVRGAQAALDASQAKLDLLRAGSRAEEVERAEAAESQAQAELDRVRAGSRPQEIAQAEAAVRSAVAERDIRARDVARKRALFDRGVVARKDVERLEADLTQAEADVEARREVLSLIRAGSRPEEIRAAESRLRESQATLKQVRAGARPEELREALANVASAELLLAKMRQSRAELDALDARLRAASQRVSAGLGGRTAAAVIADRMIIRSPLAGIVTRVLTAPGDGVSEQGPVAEIMRRDAFRAVLDVPAGLRSRILPGARAELTLVGEKNPIWGEVRAVVDQANAETGLTVAEVWIASPGRRLADGMAVSARIRLGRARVALVIPAQAVFTREGEQFVYRIGPPAGAPEADESSGGKPAGGVLAVAEHAVEVGAEREGSIEIRRGLSAGDRVVRDGSLSLADGAAVRVGP